MLQVLRWLLGCHPALAFPWRFLCRVSLHVQQLFLQTYGPNWPEFGMLRSLLLVVTDTRVARASQQLVSGLSRLW